MIQDTLPGLDLYCTTSYNGRLGLLLHDLQDRVLSDVCVRIVPWAG